jgi:hypothetical protein
MATALTIRSPACDTYAIVPSGLTAIAEGDGATGAATFGTTWFVVTSMRMTSGPGAGLTRGSSLLGGGLRRTRAKRASGVTAMATGLAGTSMLETDAFLSVSTTSMVDGVWFVASLPTV